MAECYWQKLDAMNSSKALIYYRPTAWEKDVSWIMLPNPLMTQLLQSKRQPVRGGVQSE